MSKNNFDELDKTMVAFATIMALFIAFGGGVRLEQKDWYGVGLAIITALFFVGILFAVLAQRFHNLKDQITARDRDLEMLKRVDNPPKVDVPPVLREILGKAKEALAEKQKHDEELAELAAAITKDVLNNEHREATPEEIAKIEAKFHDESDGHYLKIHATNSEGIDMEISEDPIDHVPGRSDAHEAARLRGDAARAQSPAPAEKPLTKSQQRRINTKKGFGPLTDDELREKRNAERREKRAAKKAELEAAKEKIGGGQDDNSKPLPGQTKLVE